MAECSFGKRLEAIIGALLKASPADPSIGMPRTGKNDALDRLVDSIEGLLRRFRESMERLENARQAMLDLRIPEGVKEEDELFRERKLLIDALEENIPDKIYFKDLLGRFIHLSGAHARSFGLADPRDVIGKTDFDLFTEEHAKAAFADEQMIIRTGEPILNKEEKETWPDRPDTWVLTTKMPLRDRGGRIVGTFGISRDITEYKQTVEALKRSETRYRVLFNSINDAVFVHGVTGDGLPGRITEVNEIACERLGYTREEMLCLTPLDLYAPEYAAKAGEMMSVLRREKHSMWEGVQLGKDGRRIHVEISDHLFEMAGEETILATVRDISARKQLEENLERQRTLLLTLIDNLPDFVSVKDTESRILITNAANARIMGAEMAQEVVGKTDLDFYPPAEAERYLFDEKEIMRTATPLVNKEEASFDREGQKRWTLTTKVPLKDARGRVIGMVCTGRDITERKRAEEHIQDLARISDESPNPIMRVSPEGRILYENQSSSSQLISWSDGRERRVPGHYMRELGLAWASGEKRQIEARDGQNVFQLTIAPIAGRGYINLYGRDITEEKSLSEKFMQSQKMEAIGRLAGGIAHDFNNLLTVIGGYCGLVLDELQEGSAVKAQVHEISSATRRAAGLTAQLLAFSRKQVLIPRIISPNDIVRAVENILARLMGEDVELKTFLHPDTGNFKADPGQIEQVLMNLVVNARDAMPEGGKLTIETSNRTLGADYAAEHPGAVPGEYVRISVSDTGQGMEKEVLSHIFEPFFTTKERGKGTGLGLSTVYGIVKQSEGYINCYSEPGNGTTFALYFPRVAGELERAGSAGGEAASLHGTETILLVEDEETVRQFTRTVLLNSGYAVVSAPGGGEALAAVESHGMKVDLLVTDVVMPQMSGKELAHKLLVSQPGMKVLFISGYTGNSIVHHGILDPGIDFMQKPFDSKEFLAKVREILNRS